MLFMLLQEPARNSAPLASIKTILATSTDAYFPKATLHLAVPAPTQGGDKSSIVREILRQF